MNAKDLQIKVGRQMEQLGSVPSFASPTRKEKQKVITDFEEAILDYTSEKVLETGNKSDLVSDLGFMFDILDNYFQSEPEKEEFYGAYVFAMLNIHNNLEQDSVLWSPIEDPEKEVSYPRFTKWGEYISVFETNKQESNKEHALWLYSQLTTRYKNEKSYIKK